MQTDIFSPEQLLWGRNPFEAFYSYVKIFCLMYSSWNFIPFGEWNFPNQYLQDQAMVCNIIYCPRTTNALIVFSDSLLSIFLCFHGYAPGLVESVISIFKVHLPYYKLKQGCSRLISYQSHWYGGKCGRSCLVTWWDDSVYPKRNNKICIKNSDWNRLPLHL